jgi:hypothetical protein
MQQWVKNKKWKKRGAKMKRNNAIRKLSDRKESQAAGVCALIYTSITWPIYSNMRYAFALHQVPGGGGATLKEFGAGVCGKRMSTLRGL